MLDETPSLYGPDGKPLNTKPIHEDETTPNTGTESKINTGDGNPLILGPASIPPAPPAVTHHHITYQPQKDWRDKIKFWFEIGGIILLGVYTFFTIKMYCANKEAADAARDAANAASNQVTLMSEQLRPLCQIRVDAVLSPWEGGNSPFPYPTGVTVSLQNVGPSVANNVHIITTISARPIRDSRSSVKIYQRSDFTIPHIDSVSSSMSVIRMSPPPPTTRSFSFNISKEEKISFPDAQLKLVTEGTMTYGAEFKKTITEPFCWVYWSYWSRDGKGQTNQLGNTVTCADFDNSIVPRMSEMIETQKRHQAEQSK